MSVQSFFNQTPTIKKAGAVNRFGTRTTGATVTEKGRIQRDRRTFIGPDGRESEIRAIIYTRKDADIAREDLIVIDGEDMHVIGVEPAVHGRGNTHHLKVLAGRVTGS